MAIYFIFYLVCALNVIWGVMKRKSNVLYAIAFIVIFTLMSFNIEGPDIGNYIEAYETVGEAASLRYAFSSTYMERGYTLLMYCANKIGMDFFAFRIVLSVVCLALFASTIRYFKVNPNFIVGLYMVHLFFFDTIQLRNCIIQFIVLFALRYLFQKSGRSILKYIVCIIVAGSIHTLAWLYLSLLLIRLMKQKRGYAILFIISAVSFSVCVVVQPVLPSILSIVSRILHRGTGYFESLRRFNQFAVLALHFLAFLPLWLYVKTVTDEPTRNQLRLIMRMEIILSLFLPFCFINNNFNRIFRNFLIMEMIGLVLLYEKATLKTKKRCARAVFPVIIAIGWFAYDLYYYRRQPIVSPILHGNLLFEGVDVNAVLLYILIAFLCFVSAWGIRQIINRRKPRRRNIA